LDSSLDRQTRHEWTKKESLALTLRGDYLKIYQVQPNKGESRESIPVIWLILGFTISASHKVPFNTTPEVKSDPKNVSWLEHGLKVEQKQYVFVSAIGPS
jgi:hypothetical protein